MSNKVRGQSIRASSCRYSTTTIYKLSFTDFHPKRTISKAGLLLDILDADRLPKADSPPTGRLIIIIKLKEKGKIEIVSRCDDLRCGCLISQSDVKQRKRVTEQNELTLAQLKKGRYGAFCVSHDTIFNLSDVKLTDIQKDTLCGAPRFGVPCTTRNEDVLYKFEVFYRRLSPAIVKLYSMFTERSCSMSLGPGVRS